RYTRMAATLNAMPNPFFRNPLKEPRYLITRFLPWLPGFLSVVLRSSRRTRPVEAVLADITNNQPLIDMISQHFFKGTPANFALGYFANFQDYLYPQGGTGSIPQALTQYITAKGGRILTNTKAVTIDARQQILTDDQGTKHPYDALLWTADLKSLYRQLTSPPGSPPRQTAPRQDKIQDKIQKEAASYTAVPAGESVFTIFLAVDSPPESFSQISHGHFIYTPKTQGLGSTHRQRLANIKARFAATSKNELLAWLRDFCALNAYEISIPALKDPSLAPPGKTGLVISLLMDGELCTMIDKAGWFAEFKKAAADYMIETLEASIYPGLAQKIIFRQTATPLTIMERFASDNGAITGWSLEAPPPVPATLAGIMNTPKTAIPAVYKAGQWAYSPSGVPIAILTGRIAAWAIRSALKKRT
ncbi:MAG: NAD(P)/FAD-dependent oxidoreductase, partial [Spirochaetaceae bacterium]